MATAKPGAFVASRIAFKSFSIPLSRLSGWANTDDIDIIVNRVIRNFLMTMFI